MVNEYDNNSEKSNNTEEETYNSSYEINNWDDLDNDPDIKQTAMCLGTSSDTEIPCTD